MIFPKPKEETYLKGIYKMKAYDENTDLLYLFDKYKNGNEDLSATKYVQFNHGYLIGAYLWHDGWLRWFSHASSHYPDGQEPIIRLLSKENCRYIIKEDNDNAVIVSVLPTISVGDEYITDGENNSQNTKHGDDIAREFAIMAENAGARLITIHGRVREDYYSGEPNYNAIYKAKKSVGIPVIANGGIFDENDADKMMNETGADGIMLARGGISNPFLVSELLGRERDKSLKEFMIEHLIAMSKNYPDRTAALEFRKFVPYYFKGKDGVKDIKKQIYSAERTSIILEILNKSL